MRKAMIGVCWMAALAMSGAAMAQQQGSQPGGQNGPQPNRQQEKQGAGLFPPKQPVPLYSTSRNDASASLQSPGVSNPNAGNTGLMGSGSMSYGWKGVHYGGPQR